MRNSKVFINFPSVRNIKTKTKKRKCLWNPEDPRRIRWDLLIMLLATINCFQVPYNVAFPNEIDESVYSTVLDALINLFFILDIFINFCTTYTDTETQDEITNFKLIAKHYVKGRFWIDLIASIPFDYFIYLYPMGDTFFFELFSLLKLVRILRLSKLITYLNLRNEVKSSLRLIKLVFFLLLFLHCLGCCWFFIAKQTEKWIPPLDYVYIITDIYNEGHFMQYCTSMYHAVLLLGGNDIGPRGEIELIFIVIILLICAIVNAIIFGNFAVMLQSLNRKSSKFQEKLESATDVMKNLSLKDDINTDIRYYIEYTNNTQESQKEMDAFLSGLSPSLRKRVIINIFRDAILENKIFKGQEDVMSMLCDNLTIRLFLPEDKILIQGEEADSLFFIANGEADVYVTDEHKSDNLTATLTMGSYFGEVALLKGCKRTATVISRNYSTCAELHRSDFDKVLIRYPFIQKLMEQHIQTKYNDKWRRFMHRSLRNIDYLQDGIPNKVIDEIIYKFEVVSINKDDYLFQAGTPCTGIYIVSSGELDVYLK